MKRTNNYFFVRFDFFSCKAIGKVGMGIINFNALQTGINKNFQKQ